MGQFANTLLSGLLGWVQSVAAEIWQLVMGREVSAWLHWLLDNWLLLVLFLCAAGIAADLLVYIFRWQPYRMWGRFLRSLTGRRSDDSAQDEQDDEAQYQREWVYADGTTALEDVRRTAPQEKAADEHLELPVRPVRRASVHAKDEKAYYQPVYPPQWQHTTKEEHSGGRK